MDDSQGCRPSKQKSINHLKVVPLFLVSSSDDTVLWQWRHNAAGITPFVFHQNLTKAVGGFCCAFYVYSEGWIVCICASK